MGKHIKQVVKYDDDDRDTVWDSFEFKTDDGQFDKYFTLGSRVTRFCLVVQQP